MKIVSFIKKENLKSWLEKISKVSTIYLPIHDKKKDIIDFLSWTDFIEKKKASKDDNDERYEINLIEKTKKSPKYIFFPPTEKLFEFEYKKDIDDPELVNIDLKTSFNDVINIYIGDNNKKNKVDKKIIFAIRPCDLSALKKVDIFFGEGDIKDPYYLKRRKNTIFISLGCNEPYLNCFCTAVEGNPFNFEYADMGMIKIEDGFAILKLDNKVKFLIEENKELFENKNLENKYREKIDIIMTKAVEKIINYWSGVTIDDIHSNIEKNFNLDMWKTISKKCISCAACTYVCPSCYCFNIRDEQKDLKGERYRCWDYCMNYYYNLEASGHNPRSEIYKRYRNKVNCKYNYNYKRSGQFFCVGCGRCIDICPVGMDIRESVDKICRAKF